MRHRIDLNCDLGEELDPWEPGVDGLDTLLLDVVTSANVACGFHAGTSASWRRCAGRLRLAGWRSARTCPTWTASTSADASLDVPADVLRAQVTQQIETLQAVARGEGARVAYVKPHGALYNTVVHHEEHARAVVAAITDLPVLGLPGSALLAAASGRGLRAVTEAFADRGYRADGTLVPRSEPGALVTDADEVAARVLRLATDGVVRAVDGTDVAVVAESVCVHSDTPGAAALARSVRVVLEDQGVAVVPFVA